MPEIKTVGGEEREEDAPPKVNIWDEIMAEYYAKRQEIEEYQRSKVPEPDPPSDHPIIAYFNDKLYPTLNKALAEVLKIIMDRGEMLFAEDYFFDPLDFIAEYLYNSNPLYPERKLNWMEIKDVVWH